MPETYTNVPPDHAELAAAGLCQCGCGQPVGLADRTSTQLGWVKGQPKRFLRGHAGGPQRTPDYRIDEETGCWLWLKTLSRSGYATYGREGQAARVYYERFKGRIAAGLQVDHLCRNPACVNPEHLQAVTPRENQRRGLTSKLTPDDVRRIRLLAANGTPFTQIADEFGISRPHASRIAARKHWGDVSDEPTTAEMCATAEALIARAIGWLERGAVCVQNVLDIEFDPESKETRARASLEGVRDALVRQRNVLVDEQADSLRRAEGQA